MYQPVVSPRVYRTAHMRKTSRGNVCAMSGIQTHNPSVCAVEDSTCLRPHNHWSLTHVKYMSESGRVSIIFIQFVVLLLKLWSVKSQGMGICMCVCVYIFYSSNSYVITNMIIILFCNCCLLINQCGLEGVFLHFGHIDWCPDSTDM